MTEASVLYVRADSHNWAGFSLLMHLNLSYIVRVAVRYVKWKRRIVKQQEIERGRKKKEKKTRKIISVAQFSFTVK